KDPNADVRRAAAEKILEQRERRAVPELVARVADAAWSPDSDGQDKRKALRALEDLSPESVRRAMQLAVLAKSVQVRVWACREIAQLGDRNLVSALVTALQDEHPHVRIVAAEALRDLRWADDDAIQELATQVSRES